MSVIKIKSSKKKPQVQNFQVAKNIKKNKRTLQKLIHVKVNKEFERHENDQTKKLQTETKVIQSKKSAIKNNINEPKRIEKTNFKHDCMIELKLRYLIKDAISNQIDNQTKNR